MRARARRVDCDGPSDEEGAPEAPSNPRHDSSRGMPCTPQTYSKAEVLALAINQFNAITEEAFNSHS